MELVGRTYRQLASAHPRALDPEAVAGFTRVVRLKAGRGAALATGRRLRPEIQSPFELGWIECPVLVIWGEKDRMVSAKGAERILAEVKGSRAEIIPDCGHCPQVETPETVASLLAEFTRPALHEAA